MMIMMMMMMIIIIIIMFARNSSVQQQVPGGRVTKNVTSTINPLEEARKYDAS